MSLRRLPSSNPDPLGRMIIATLLVEDYSRHQRRLLPNQDKGLKSGVKTTEL